MVGSSTRPRRSTKWLRHVDRYIGIPALAAFGLLRRRKDWPEDVRRIGLLQPTAIGDVILASGIFPAIRDRYPNAEIYLLHGASNAVVRQILPPYVNFVQLDSIGMRALRTIRSLQLDIAIDLTPWPRATALLVGLSGAHAIGFNAKRQFRAWAFDTAIGHHLTRHEFENHAALSSLFSAKPYGYSLAPAEVALPTGVDPDNLVLFHLSAGGSQASTKEWPVARWADLARRLASLGYSIGISGTAADAAAANDVIVQSQLPQQSIRSLCGKTSIRELAILLGHVRLLITIDTGVLHLASALDTPMIALHGPTSSKRWGSLSSKAVSIEARHPDHGYIDFGYEPPPSPANLMSLVSVEEVFQGAQEILRRESTAATNRSAAQ